MEDIQDLAIASSNLLKCTPLSGNYHECRPLFIEDKELLLCAYGSVIQAISSLTGELVKVFRGHDCVVTCIVSVGNTGASVSILTASLDGRIILWRLVRIDLSMGVYCIYCAYA